MTISSMDLTTYLSVTTDGDYEASIGGYNSTDLLTYLNGVWHTASIGASNKTRTSVPEIDALIDEAAATIVDEERFPILEECTKLINENVGQIPLYLDNSKRAHNAKLVAPELGKSNDLNLNMAYWVD